MPLINIRRRMLGAVAAALLTCLGQPAAVAITINIEYSTDFGGDESPSWDPDGAILIAHFQAAKQIWEALLPGPGEISFDFQWDDDIDGLGLYTPNPLDIYIEINSTLFWFADPTPNDSSEFDVPVQTLYSQLSPALQSSHFPGTAPPGALEVGYRGAGITNSATLNTLSLSNQDVPANDSIPAGKADARNSFDLLSTVVHEMGHALGLSGIEPGNYNILPVHVGGLAGVEVLEGGGGHLAGQGNVPYLMCENCGVIGQRRFPTATDILVIAEEQDITNVKLARVGRISAGNWNNTNAWIGAKVPDATQDAYVRNAGAVTLDINATVKSLAIDGGANIDAAGFQLVSAGDIQFLGAGSVSVGSGGKVSASSIRYDGGVLSAGAGGTFSADSFHGDPSQLYTAVGSTVEFNDFTRGASSATEATFNGNVKIGVGDGENLVSFNPNAIATWMIGQNLTVGTFLQPTQLVIDDGAWTVAGNLDIRPGSEVIVDAGEFLGAGSYSGGSLAVTGPVTVDGGLTYRSGIVSNTNYAVAGGAVVKFINPPNPTILKKIGGGGAITFDDATQGIAIGTNVTSTNITVAGGSGDGASGGVITFKGRSHADDAQFSTGAGIGGDSLRISNPVVIAGEGGRVHFKDNSYADGGFYSNYGVDAHGPSNSGGATVFYDDSRAHGATFDNYGATLQGYSGAVPAPGGRTVFTDNASASYGTFNNHPGQGMGSLGAGITVFSGNSNAGSSISPAFIATYNNLGGVPGAQFGGATEFYDEATAGRAVFYNQHANGVTQHAGSAGNVRFYGNSTAGNATFYNQVGGGAVFFNESSNAGDAHFFIEDTGTATFGGHVVFNGNSRGGTSDITVRENAFSATVEFRGTSNAQNAEITLVNGSQAYVQVTNSGSLGNATVDIGAGGSLTFNESATAADSTIRLRPGGGASFTGTNTTAANATFTLDGATVANGGTGSLFCSGCKGGDATFYVNAGTAFNAAGAQLNISSGANLGTAKVIGAGATVPGAGGARISLDASSTAANASFTIGAGGYLALYGFGTATIGSLDLDAAGSIFLQQTGLSVGGLNTSNTISGQISGFVGNGNAKLTKVGTGTLTLTGANTYAGLTTVDGGTLAINGSTPGAVEVNSGAILKGTGNIGGTVTVNSGGTLAPGASPGTLSIGGLAMTSGSILEFELGATAYDRILASGNIAFAGTLNVSLFGGFMPTLGSMFDLFNWGTKSGTFSTVNLPTLTEGLSWDTTHLYNTGVISVMETPGISGDYNDDGVVNAADYVLWRDHLGAATSLPNDATAGVALEDYGVWKQNFGAPAGGGSSTTAAVPEPTTLVLLIAGMLAFTFRRAAAS